MDRKYAIDSNILISSSRNFYSFEIAPSFWRQIIEKGHNKIIIVDKIRDEICRNEDELSQWLKTNESLFIIKNSGDNNILENYAKISTSVKK